LLFTGRIAPNKNCIELLEQAALASDKMLSPLRLIIIGDIKQGCTYGKEFEKKIIELSNHKWLTINWIRGGIDNKELSIMYTQTWLYVSMSLHEGFGLPVCEAVEHGTPALFIECGGTESVIGLDGMVKKDERVNFHCDILKLLNSNKLRDDLLKKQSIRVSEFKDPLIADNIKNIYSTFLVKK
jgi:glycosyltransferase involved in cell wall biosynthesis